MERLTKSWGNNCVSYKIDYGSLGELSQEEFKAFDDIVRKLAHYETLEEQGKLIVLDESKQEMMEATKIVNEKQIKVGNITFGKGTTVYKCPACKTIVSRDYYCRNCGQKLKYDFTKEEAEAKLKEIKNE